MIMRYKNNKKKNKQLKFIVQLLPFNSPLPKIQQNSSSRADHPIEKVSLNKHNPIMTSKEAPTGIKQPTGVRNKF